MITAPFPAIFARTALKARTLLQAAFRKWYAAGHYKDEDVSLAASLRMDVNRENGIKGDEIADDVLGLLFVSTTNAAPTLFWLFLNVFSSPSLMEALRTEILSVMTKGKGNEMVIDHTKFPSQCPLLCSAYQETLRMTNIQSSTRYVTEDTVLASDSREYLFKKGSLVQMPGSVFHILPTIWGDNAASYNPRRFIRGENEDKVQDRLQKKAFIPFGGGKHLCPGRHFAFAEILGIVAVMVIGFEIEGVDGGPVTNVKGVRSIVNASLQPGEQGLGLRTKIRRRLGWEQVQWKFVNT